MWDGLTFPSIGHPDPRMAVPLANGHVLVSGGKDCGYVKEVDRAGNVVWEYTATAAGPLVRPFSAEPATFGGSRAS